MMSEAQIRALREEMAVNQGWINLANAAAFLWDVVMTDQPLSEAGTEEFFSAWSGRAWPPCAPTTRGWSNSAKWLLSRCICSEGPFPRMKSQQQGDITMAYIPKIDPVKIDQLDLGEIQKDNALSAMYDQHLQDMAYQSNSRNAMNDILRANSDISGPNFLREMSSKGFGEAGQKYAYNWLNRQHASLQYETDLRKEVSGIIGSVTDEASKNRAIDYLQDKFPDATGQLEQFRTVPWQTARDQGNTFLLGGAGRVTKDRQDAALQSQGYAPGQDPNTLSTISSMRNAADANQRGWNADSRAAAAEGRAQTLFSGQVQQQGASLEHTNLSNDALRQSMESEQKVLVGPGGIRMRPDDAYTAFQKSAYANPDMSFADFLRQGQFRIGTYNPKTKALTLDGGQPFGADGATPPQQGGAQPSMGSGQPTPRAGFGSGAGFGGAAPQQGGNAPAPAQQPGGTAGAAGPQGGATGAYVQKGNGRPLTPEMAARYKEMAGGNRSKAEYLAKYDGWTWPQ